MKLGRKIVSLLLVAVMLMAVCSSAMAEAEGELTGGSISINDAITGQVYKLYQILYLDSMDQDLTADGTAANTTGKYAYKANSEWLEFVERNDIADVYLTTDAAGYVTWVGEQEATRVAAFAKLAKKYASDKGITPVATDTATSTTVNFNNIDLKLGYYLIDSTLGTLCSLDTTNKKVVMEEKNEVPSNDKEVEEDSKEGNWYKKDDADIGQVVKFRSKVDIPNGSENVVFYDKMSDGLTLNANSIKVYTDAGLTSELSSDNYTIVLPSEGQNLITNSGNTDIAQSTFNVTFKQTYLDKLNATNDTHTTTLYVAYNATLNEKAIIAGAGNPNDCNISYGDSTNTKYTPKKTTISYTWPLAVYKYINDTTGTDGKSPLEGVVFKLLANDKTTVIKVVSARTKEGTEIPIYRVDESGNETITTDKTGKFEIEGLDADTYYIEEVSTPAGYNKLAGKIKVVISSTDDYSNGTSLTHSVKYYDYTGKGDGYQDATEGTGEIQILNQSGVEMPSTGGMGTTILYVVGGLLVVAAAVLLVTKKRVGAEK